MASMTNKKKTSFKRTEKYQRTGYKFIAPGLLMMVLLIIYPMIQRFFEKGIMMGSIKG